MMGRYLQSGYEPAAGMGVYSTAAAPALAPLYAIPVWGQVALVVASLLPLIFRKWGYNPQKLHDTQVVEAAQMAFNLIWFQVTGEALDGIREIAPPGQYGAQHKQLFGQSQYPNVPAGPLGDPAIDIDTAISSATLTFRDAASTMQRPESIPNIQGNYDALINLLNRVKEARKAAGPLASIDQLMPPAVRTAVAAIPGGWLTVAAAGAFLVTR